MAFLLLAIFSVPTVAATHASPKTLWPTTATGSGWSNPSNAVGNDNNHASASDDGKTLLISGYSTSGLSGTISSVDLVVDQSQANHVNDGLTWTVTDNNAGCGTIAESPADPEPTAVRGTLTVSLSCPAGWTWARLAALKVQLTTVEVGRILLISGVDGEWRIYDASLVVTYENLGPAAKAGDDQWVMENGPVQLDGTASSDPEGRPLTYAWSQLAGPSVTLAGATTANPSFTAPTLSTNGAIDLRFNLVVTDSEGHTHDDPVDITVENENQAPIADAGDDQTVAASSTVTLDGSASHDPDGDVLTYDWSQVSGAPVTLSDPVAARPTFTAPSAAGLLVFSFHVHDPLGLESPPVDVSVTVAPGSTATSTPTTTTSSTAPAPTTTAPATSSTPAPTSSAPAPTEPTPTEEPEPTLPTLTSSSSSSNPVKRNILLRPDVATLNSGDRVDFEVLWRQDNGALSKILTPLCTWDLSKSGGSLQGDDPKDCAQTFVAGNQSLVEGKVSVKVTYAAGIAQAHSKITITVPAQLVDPNALRPGEAADCSGRFDVNASAVGLVPIQFDASCGVDLVVVQPPLNQPGPMRLQVTRMKELPGEAPEPSTAPDRYIRILLFNANGVQVQPRSAVIHFALDRDWYNESCPEDVCEAKLYHLGNSGTWEPLSAAPAGETNESLLFQAHTSAFSYFAPGVAPLVEARGSLPFWLLPLLVLGIVGVGAGTYVVARRRAPESQKAIEQELRNEELVGFLNSAAHDLASPLTPIQLQLSMLQAAGTGDLSPAQQRALGVVARNVEHMGMLVKDLRDASRLQAGKLQVFPEDMDLAAVVREVGDTFIEQAKLANISLKTCADEESVIVRADKGRINQVLYNLVGNAMKFTPAGGTVDVSLKMEGGAVAVIVKDTGLGLTAQDITKLFKPFAQVHDAAQRKKGSGLGLYICKGIVEAHGGRIDCSSEGKGLGSTFTFALPASGEAGLGPEPTTLFSQSSQGAAARPA